MSWVPVGQATDDGFGDWILSQRQTFIGWVSSEEAWHENSDQEHPLFDGYLLTQWVAIDEVWMWYKVKEREW